MLTFANISRKTSHSVTSGPLAHRPPAGRPGRHRPGIGPRCASWGSRILASPGAFMSRRRGIPGLSFSWRRALGVSQAQARLSRNIGLPLSRSGRQQKAARALGCSWALSLPLVGAAVLWRFLTI